MQPATAQLESTKWYENGISALCGGWVGGGDNEDTGASRVENMLRVLAARQSTVLTRDLQMGLIECQRELARNGLHRVFDVCNNIER